MTDSFRIKYENIIKPNDALETSTLVPHVNVKTVAFAPKPNLRTYWWIFISRKGYYNIVMIGVTINIYGGTPVFSKFTKNV